MEDGRVLRLERRFDEISADSEFIRNGKPIDSSPPASPELEGATIVFEWDDDDGEYRASSEDVDGDVLDGLRFDLDCTALLPDGEVAVGDEWPLDPDAFVALTWPWRGLGLEGEPDSLETSADGELTARFTGQRELDGTAVAVIAIEGEYESESVADIQRADENGSVSSHSKMLTTMTVEGEALWDLTGGHLQELRLDAELAASGTVEISFSSDVQEFEHTNDLENKGTWSFEASFTSVH